jgi:hypothetical protein
MMLVEPAAASLKLRQLAEPLMWYQQACVFIITTKRRM